VSREPPGILAQKGMIVPDTEQSLRDSKTGRRTVLGMLAFGVVMVALLWLYWEMYTRPFRPLQNAIAAAYPHSRPSVIGGRHKSHKPDSPHVLRLVLQMPLSDFNPQLNEGESHHRAIELARLADKYVPLTKYDVLEIHLVQRPPERPQRHWVESHPIEEWQQELSVPME